MTMKGIKELLSEQPFFKDLLPEHIDYIASCAQNMHFEPGAIVGKEGDPASHFYIVRKGRMAIQIQHPLKGPINILTVQEGDYAGFSWIVPPYKLRFDIKALNHTSVLAIDGNCLRGKCEANYELGYLLMQQVARIMVTRLQEIRMQLLDVYKVPS
jgi:CRP/FNR family cyclic AMP-dependent transcriptional regulator